MVSNGVFLLPWPLRAGTVWPSLSPSPPVPPTTATQPQWFLRPLVVSPVSAVVSKQLVSGVEPQRPRGAQVQDPVLLQLEKLLLPEGPDHAVHQGDPQVVDGLLHVALVELLEVASEATVVPPPHPEVGLVLGEPLLEVLGGPNIVPRGGAGAQDVVDQVPGGTGEPPGDPPHPPVLPVGDGGDLLQGPGLVEEAPAPGGGAGVTPPLLPLPPLPHRVGWCNVLAQVPPSGEGRDYRTPREYGEVVRVVVEDGLELPEALLDVGAL